MILSSFLSHIERTKKLPVRAVLCFSGAVYPVLFFYHFFSFLKKHTIFINYINCDSTDILSIKALLSTMSFCGTQQYYWLVGYHELAIKKQQELFAYLKVYNGPHVILLFTHDTTIALGVDSAMEVIDVPDKIKPHELAMVRFFVNDHGTIQSTEFTGQLALYTDNLSLDSACLFAHYEIVMGKNVTDFFSQWTAHIIEPTSSLFILSQHFFSKRSALFFRQWAAISSSYAPSFWAIFWADQVWRAYIFCDLMNKKKYAESKKAQYKLPFSFINRDWSLYRATELRNMHHFLFELDHRLKNGATDIGLDCFYNKFFENKFR